MSDRLAIGARVVVVRSDHGHAGKTGTVTRYAHGWHYPYIVRLDGGPEILTNDVGVQPID